MNITFDAMSGSVGNRIRSTRVARGWTQDQLAVEVGVSRSAVAQWETDRAGQVRGNLSRIADALGVSVEYLLNGTAVSQSTGGAVTGDEMALLRMYRSCDAEDRSFLLRTARKLAKSALR
jgi:transcriptional regulator with XRE-family HTH domain